MTTIRPNFLFFNFKIYFITFPVLLGNNWHTSLYKFKAYSMTVLIDVYCEMIATVGSAKIHLPIHRFLISWIMLWVLHKALEDSCIFSWAVLILMLLNRIVTVSLFFFTFFFFFYWSILSYLNCCINFCCTAKWMSHMYTHISSLLDFLPI